MKKAVVNRDYERGGVGAKLLIVIVLLILIGNAGYQWIPFAYNAESFKQDMQTAVLQAITISSKTSNPVDTAKNRIMRSAVSNAIPSDAYIDVSQKNQVLQAHVVFTKPIPLLPFGLYNYNYEFDYTATPTGYLMKE